MEVTGVYHAYGRRAVLGGVDLRLRPGVLAGIVGENGAGKTTLLRILSGELAPDRGTVRHDGGFGYCPQAAVLMLNEPYQGFDWETYQRFWDLATRLREDGRSVLVVSHLAYDAERLDTLWRLDGGRVHGQITEPTA